MASYPSNTIAAIATPLGFGGIGIVRLSGAESLLLTQSLIGSTSHQVFLPNRVTFRALVHPETHQVLDDALITYFKAPHSYTGEDVVEIACHGSPVVLAEIIRILISSGASLAEPGEFTMRAFFNRRIDLSQAEAVNDLIHSQTKYQAQVAARQLRGELAKQLNPIKDVLVETIVHFESAVEFVEDDLSPLNIERFKSTIALLIEKINQLAATYRYGRLIRAGLKLALIGSPNVGKSSVFNSLLGKDRAIVTDQPGTTRDTLSEVFSLNGIPVELVDTAGIRETEDKIERLGVERTHSAIADADFVIGVVEANRRPSSEERALFVTTPIDFLIINKADLNNEWSSEMIQEVALNKPFLNVSALTGEGIDELRNKLNATFSTNAHFVSEGGIITNERHYAALTHSVQALQKATQDLDNGFSEEVVLVHLHECLHHLGVITGETLIGDIINQIFSTFCIGK